MRHTILRSLVAFSLLAAVSVAPALAQPAAGKPAPPTPPGAVKTRLTWYGHAAFRIDTPAGKVILVDPWLQNPKNPNGKDDLAKLTAADLILVTHGHSDHVGDAVAIAKKTKAKLVSTFDLGKSIVLELGFPKDQIGMDTMGNFGGDVTLLDGEVTVRFVPAVHSSGTGKDDNSLREGGAPGGFVIAIKGGPVLYHTGDTDVFGDMQYIGKDFKVTHMLGCIGGHFTMGPSQAAEAARLVKPKTFVPMHYGTFPLLAGTVDQLKAALKKKAPATKVLALEVGKTTEL
jgi:L-ascorbate metabolism protein UlaG (beta-lactamase superfamily)